MIKKLLLYILKDIIGFHIHNWSEWEDYGSGIYFQQRECLDCRKIKLRNINISHLS